ncbi:unnamed protein product [Calypogeia fissa]
MMKVVLGSWCGTFHRLLLLAFALLQCIVVTHLSVMIDAAKYPGDELAELQRSLARYGDSIDHDGHSKSFMRDLLQVDEEENQNSAGKKENDRAAEEQAKYAFPSEPYRLGVKINDWDEQRKRWLEANPSMKSMPDGKPRVLIVTGSQPYPCHSPRGDHFHLRSLKLKIDYARMHNYEIFYNFVHLDPLFGTYWVKLPTIRSLMLSHPEIEWFIWVDSDAVFTDMLFEPPFHKLDEAGKHMAMWSWEEGLWKHKSWVSVNVGVFLIRNCQWSFDLIDKWSPMGPEGPVRVEYGKMLSNFLQRYDNYPADDQSALIYLMLTDEEVMSKIQLVETEYIISGWWVSIVDTFERSIDKYHPGLGDRRWPWITHFTGCSPCSGGNNPEFSYEMCMLNITKAFNFAENQVLAYMGYEHATILSTEIVRVRNETTRPLDFVGINPWKEKMAQLAAETAAAKSS